MGVGTPNATQLGPILGTPGFMPPEQARGHGQKVGTRSDIWSIGATLFTLLTGRAVHEAATPREALLLAMTAPVPPVHSLEPALPRSLCSALDTSLAFDKDRRFRSARAMQQALRACMLDLEASCSAGSTTGPANLAPATTVRIPSLPMPGSSVPGTHPFPSGRAPAGAVWELRARWMDTAALRRSAHPWPRTRSAACM